MQPTVQRTPSPGWKHPHCPHPPGKTPEDHYYDPLHTVNTKMYTGIENLAALGMILPRLTRLETNLVYAIRRS